MSDYRAKLAVALQRACTASRPLSYEEIADAVLAVRDAELERLRAELTEEIGATRNEMAGQILALLEDAPNPAQALIRLGGFLLRDVKHAQAPNTQTRPNPDTARPNHG